MLGDGELPDLPGVMEYWAQGDVAWAFHPAFWPDFWMAHVGMKPEGRGRSDEDSMAVLRGFWAEKRPRRIIAWMDTSNRAVLAFAKRVGFVPDARIDEIEMWSWICP